MGGLANGRVPDMRAFGGMVRVGGRFFSEMVMGFCGALLALCGERVKREICSYGGFTWVANGTVSKGRASGCSGLPGGRVCGGREACEQPGAIHEGFQRAGLLDAVVCLGGGFVVDERLANGRVPYMRAFGGGSGGWAVLFWHGYGLLWCFACALR